MTKVEKHALGKITSEKICEKARVTLKRPKRVTLKFALNFNVISAEFSENFRGIKDFQWD